MRTKPPRPFSSGHTQKLIKNCSAQYNRTIEQTSISVSELPEYSCGDLHNDNDSFIEEITKKAEKDAHGQYYCGDIQQDESVAQ